MVTLDLGKPADDSGPFLILRAKAIDQYAQMESSLSILYSVLLKTDMDTAAIVFFRIANTRARNRIAEELLKKRFRDRFSHYWFGIPSTPNKRGLMTLINDLDAQRNEIVHWHVMTTINTDTDARTTTLTPPNFWADGRGKAKTIEHLAAFLGKASFVSQSIMMFCAHHGSFENPVPLTDAWRDIYQRPCVYPPPNNHPLSPTNEAPQTPPQSSEA
ncbi:MAG: hypothetical protein WDZ83_05315 [Rhizobiaceae bacterium]